MKKLRALVWLLVAVVAPAAAQPVAPATATFAAENAALGPPRAGERRVVFIGDSTTWFWTQRDPGFFRDKTRIDRSRGAQTTTDMQARFAADVLALQPTVVHIMGGINDIARNSGVVPDVTRDSIAAMAAAAKAAGAQVVIGSLLPCDHFNFYPDQRPAGEVVALNSWLRQLAKDNGYFYADYHARLADKGGAMNHDWSKDGLHPNEFAAAAMSKIARPVLAAALQSASTASATK
jgi:lysophospholipase L1-like esterase